MPETPRPNTDSPQPEAAIFDNWRVERDLLAGTVLITSYERFVFGVCNRYLYSLANRAGGTINWYDLRQAGINEILIQAKYFDPEHGYSFLNYAAPGIQGAIYEEYCRHHGAVELPESFVSLLLAYDQEAARRQRAWEPPMTNEELATLLDITQTGREVRESWSEPLSVPNFRTVIAVKNAASLQALAETEPAALDTMMPLTRSVNPIPPDPEEHGIRSVLRAQLKSALKILIDRTFATDPSMQDVVVKARQREKDIFTTIWGLDDGRVKSKKELAGIAGVTPSAISLVYNKALRRLKDAAKDPEFQWLRDFL